MNPEQRYAEVIDRLNARIEEQKKSINRLLAHVKHHCPEFERDATGTRTSPVGCDFKEEAVVSISFCGSKEVHDPHRFRQCTAEEIRHCNGFPGKENNGQ